MSPVTCSDSSGADALSWQGRRALDSRAIGGDENAARTDAAGAAPGQVIGDTPWVRGMSVNQTLRYNYRLRPGAAAVVVLDAEWHRSRWLWNQMVASRYDRGRRLISEKDLTAARKRLDWLATGSQNVQEQTLYTFRGKGKRAIKKKREPPVIAVEDFRTKFLFQSTMARKAADNAVGQAKRELLTYAARAGRSVVIVPPAYTTMTCSSCFARAKQRLELSERVFVCTSCGYNAGRDRNAARTILVQAQRTLASAETVRHTALPTGELLCAG